MWPRTRWGWHCPSCLLAALYKVATDSRQDDFEKPKAHRAHRAVHRGAEPFLHHREGEPLVHFWVLNIYAEGVKYAILLAVRVCALIAGTSLLTYTTSPIVLTDAIESLLGPLAKLHCRCMSLP